LQVYYKIQFIINLYNSMKRLLFAIIGVASFWQASAQCPGCVIDMACTGTTPTLCPAVLPSGTQGQPYDQDLTFFLPQTFTDAGSGTNVTLQKIVVTGLSGAPAGINWQTNSSNNTYVVTSDPNTQRGCAKVCGTPSLPGNYTITVSVIATVNTIIGVQSVPQSFTLPLEIVAAAGGNPYFSFNPSTGCGNVDVTYEALINLGLPQITEYEWDFGNGNVSTAQHPPVQSYSTPGEYHASLSTNVYNMVFTSITANVTGGWWQGIWPCNGTSIWFNLSSGGTVYSSGTTGSLNNTWNNFSPAIVLSDNLLTVDFKQKQGVCPTWDGGSAAIQINGPGTYNFSTTAVSNGGGGVNGSFTVGKQLFESYVVVDTVNVYNLPAFTNIESSSGSFNVCSNSPIHLSVYEGYNYAWYENDTTLIVGADSSSFEVPVPNNLPYTTNYKVKITDPVTGCAIFTPNVAVTVTEGVPAPFSTFGAIYSGGQLTSNYSGFASYQWLLNGTALVPSGQTQTFVPTVNGNYSLVVTTAAGCSGTSNIISIFNMGVDEMSGLDEFISVYPNPSDGEFTLNMTAATQSGLVISIIDISGKNVYQENVGKLNGTFTKTFSLQNLSSGIYTLNLQFDQGAVRRKLIIR
jgi:hypothetical protein